MVNIVLVMVAYTVFKFVKCWPPFHAYLLDLVNFHEDILTNTSSDTGY